MTRNFVEEPRLQQNLKQTINEGKASNVVGDLASKRAEKGEKMDMKKQSLAILEGGSTHGRVHRH